MKQSAQKKEIDPNYILLKTSEKVDREILQMLSELSITMRREPQTGLVMMTITDSTGTDFHPGEVLVTEAEVEYAGKIGYAMIVGNLPEKALARAAVAAIMKSADSAFKMRLLKYLEEQAEEICQEESEGEAFCASTMVNFEVMTQW